LLTATKILLSITQLNMKKILFVALTFSVSLFLHSQDNPSSKTKKKDWSKVKLTNRANDHFMVQYGWLHWANIPDSIDKRGFSNSVNVYFMIDMPFKTDPRFSVAFGPGIGVDNMFFRKTNITTTNHANELEFQNVSDTNHFDKYKLVNAFAELPIEFRFVLNPQNTNKSFKVAIGAKVGFQISTYTKGKTWQNKNENVIPGFDENYIQKNKDKYFFNGNRLVGTFRVGYGFITAFATYQLGSLIKQGLGPQVKPYVIGLTLSGL
jgi:hypothetical protein